MPTDTETGEELFRPFNINPATALRFTAGGAAAGISLAALVELLRRLRETKRTSGEPSETTDKTIVLTLPPESKRAEYVLPQEKPAKIPADRSAPVKSTGPASREKPMTTPAQIRHADGRYDIKTANWQTMTAALLGMTGGGVGGYVVLDRIIQKMRERELEKKVDASKREYLDLLVRGQDLSKTGQAADGDPARPSFHAFDYPLGLAALALVLGGGSTAWLTKKILDSYMKDPESKYRPPEKMEVRRLVFRTAPNREAGEAIDKAGEAPASSDDVFHAALGVFTDICSGSPDVLGDVKCAEAMDAAGTTPGELYKMAVSDYDKFIGYLGGNPELAATIKRMSMETGPISKYFKWSVNLPLAKQLTDTMMRDELRRGFGPQAAMWRKVEEDEMRAKIMREMGMDPGMRKGAQVNPLLGQAMSTALGINLADEVGKGLGTQEGQPAAAGPAETERAKAARIKKMIGSIEVGAADPNAAKFVAENREELRRALTILAEEGMI